MMSTFGESKRGMTGCGARSAAIVAGALGLNHTSGSTVTVLGPTELAIDVAR
jgi:hypothetical protein